MVGMDDFPLADLLDPPVTVVAQDPTAMGTLAGEILLRRIEGETTPFAEHSVPTRLIVRGSGGDPWTPGPVGKGGPCPVGYVVAHATRYLLAFLVGY